VQFLPKMSLRAFEAIKRSHFLTAKITLSLFPKFAQCELSGARQLRSPRREFIFCKPNKAKPANDEPRHRGGSSEKPSIFENLGA
jgi:hypothetical protein